MKCFQPLLTPTERPGCRLNFETVSEIKGQGYSRIPVYSEERTNIVHILYAKVVSITHDLAYSIIARIFYLSTLTTLSR